MAACREMEPPIFCLLCYRYRPDNRWQLGVMRYLKWLLRIMLFLLLLGWAVRNEQPVLLRFFFGYEWQTTLVVIMLSLFMLGVALGLAVSWGDSLRLRREMAALKRELRQKNKPEDAADTQQLSV